MAKMAKSKSKKEKQQAELKQNSSKKGTKEVKSVDLETDEKEDLNANGNGKYENATSASFSSFLTECKTYFGSEDLYTILNINKSNSSENEIKKAYYKLSLKYHPDKGEEVKREENTAKFQVLSKVYAILSDAEKKKIYDEQGIVDDETTSEFATRDWKDYWRNLFKKVTKADVDNFFAEYRNSSEERADLLRLYEKHAGDLDSIMDEIFMNDAIADEPRFRTLIQEAIDKGEVPAHKKFIAESKKKQAKRKTNYEKEARQAAVERIKLGIDESEENLKQAILIRRKAANEDFFAHLEKKYGNANNNQGDDEEKRVKRAKTTKMTTKKAANSVKKVKRL